MATETDLKYKMIDAPLKFSGMEKPETNEKIEEKREGSNALVVEEAEESQPNVYTEV